VNIKVWVNVPGGHSTLQYVYLYVASPGPSIPHRHSVSVIGLLSIVLAAIETSLACYALSHESLFRIRHFLVEYEPIDEELERV
jgi:hypothetical protein